MIDIRKERSNHTGDTFNRNEYIDSISDEIKDLKKVLENLYSENPESYTALHLKELKEYRKALDEGRLVETEYVKNIKNDLLEKMEIGKPIFVHGHLGAGKSEIAYVSARDFLIDLNVNNDFEKWREEQLEILKENGEREIVIEELKNDKGEVIRKAGKKIVKELFQEEEIKKINELKKFYQTDSSKETQKKLEFYAISGSKETFLPAVVDLKFVF